MLNISSLFYSERIWSGLKIRVNPVSSYLDVLIFVGVSDVDMAGILDIPIF